jgi:hypothetical protein
VLRGVAGSPRDQSLIANMAGLEPDIWRASNQLTVAAEAPASTPQQRSDHSRQSG